MAPAVAPPSSLESQAIAAPQAIFTADDFGASSQINHAIVSAHRDGVLTAASLMVNGEAFEEAVEIARQTPTLAVGLHLVITDGAATLPRERIPHLLNREGQLTRDPAKAGIYLALSRKARREISSELRAQFEKFAATGLRMTHVDGHMHMHIHPAVFPELVRLAREFGASGVRLPIEPLSLAPANLRNIGASGFSRAAVLNILSKRWRGLLDGSGLKYPSACYGISRTGHMTAAYVAEVVQRLAEMRQSAGTEKPIAAEFVFHPAQGPRRESLGANPGDLETLLSEQVRNALGRSGVRLANYYTLLGSSC